MGKDAKMKVMTSGGRTGWNSLTVAICVAVALLMGACGTDDPVADETLDEPPAAVVDAAVGELPAPAAQVPAPAETDDEGVMVDEDPPALEDDSGDGSEDVDETSIDFGEPVDIDVELLTAGPWVLRFGGGPSGPFDPVEGAPITIRFTNDGTFGGSTGCNGYSGTYSVDGFQAFFGEEIFADQEGCPGDVGANEAAFLEAMADVSDINVFPSELALSGVATELIFVPEF